MNLKTFFQENPSAALGFSGGVDSSYLLYAGIQYGADIRPYFIKTPFQPQFELDDAHRLAAQVGATVTVIDVDILAEKAVVDNLEDRCYFCKTALFTALRQQALRDGYTLLIDGTNASDDAGDRPGMRALDALAVRSPLRECGLTKDMIRELSREAGLFTWNKPAYACLATRIPTGIAITQSMLYRIEKAEDALHAMGFTDVRVRVFHDAARIQLPASQMPKALQLREDITRAFSPYFSSILLDLSARP